MKDAAKSVMSPLILGCLSHVRPPSVVAYNSPSKGGEAGNLSQPTVSFAKKISVKVTPGLTSWTCQVCPPSIVLYTSPFSEEIQAFEGLTKAPWAGAPVTPGVDLESDFCQEKPPSVVLQTLERPIIQPCTVSTNSICLASEKSAIGNSEMIFHFIPPSVVRQIRVSAADSLTAHPF